MFEYLATLITGIDYFGMGAFLLLLGLSIALSLIFANNNLENFLLGMIITNYMFAIAIFIGTKNAEYFIGVTVLTVLILIIPTGTKDLILSRLKGER